MHQAVAKQNKQKFFVVEDQELVLDGTINALKHQYPEAEISHTQTSQSALKVLESINIDLAIVDLVIPETKGGSAKSDFGIQLLKTIMQQHPTLNIVVQSANSRPLVKLKNAISLHEGGFTVADKSLPKNEMLIKVEWALKGGFYTPPEMRCGMFVKEEWIEMLKLAFKEGLQDIAIAKRMNVSERSVRTYWKKIQDALEVYPDEGKNLRIQTEIRAREEGLID